MAGKLRTLALGSAPFAPVSAPEGPRPLPVLGAASVAVLAVGALACEVAVTWPIDPGEGLVTGVILLGIVGASFAASLAAASMAVQRRERVIALAYLGAGTVVALVLGFCGLMAWDIVKEAVRAWSMVLR